VPAPTSITAAIASIRPNSAAVRKCSRWNKVRAIFAQSRPPVESGPVEDI